MLTLYRKLPAYKIYSDLNLSVLPETWCVSCGFWVSFQWFLTFPNNFVVIPSCHVFEHFWTHLPWSLLSFFEHFWTANRERNNIFGTLHFEKETKFLANLDQAQQGGFQFMRHLQLFLVNLTRPVDQRHQVC